jgi:glucose/arabinose dehydrogenase
MEDKISLDLTLNEWLYILALLAPFGVAVAGLAFAAASRSWKQRWPALAMAAAGAAGWLIAVLASLDRSPIDFLPFQLKVTLSDLLMGAVVGGAFVAGVVVALGLALGWRALPAGGQGAAAVRLIAPGAAVLVGVGVLLLVLDDRTADRSGAHPVLTVVTTGVEATVLADGLVLPVAVAVGPEGDVYFGELASGRVGRLVAADGMREETLFTVELPGGGQLLRLALHPAWPNPRQVFVTAQQGEGEERRLWVLAGDVSNPGAGMTRLAGPLPTTRPGRGNHTGGALAICAEYLYVSIGDTSPYTLNHPLQWAPQNPLRGEGKILRYRVQGQNLAPAGVLAEDPPVFAMGFRNPFGMGCDEESGYPVVGENGPEGHDQVRLAGPGTNHEWPIWDRRDRLVTPWYDSGSRAIAPTGVVVQGSGAAKEVFVSGHETKAVYRLVFGQDGERATHLEVVYASPSGVLGLAQDARGCLYAADESSIVRIHLNGCD